MKEFFKDKTIEDYLLMLLMGIIILGAILFVVGYFWGFAAPLSIGPSTAKTNIKQIASGNSPYYNSIYGSQIGDGVNLFKLMEIMDPSWGTAFGMCVTAIVGVSLLLFSIAIILIIMIVGVITDVIIPKIKNKNA